MLGGRYSAGMSENREPPAEFRYAVGAGLGLLVGGAVGLFVDQFLSGVLIGVAGGIVVAFFAGFIKR